jgi:hypothetical protein
MPRLPAVASQIGHGALGLRDNLRPLDELTQESVGQKQVFVEQRLGQVTTGWALYSGSTYVVTPGQVSQFDQRFAGVVGVELATEVLTRVESLTECSATPGTFYTDAPIEPGADAVYIRLSDSSDPNSTDVMLIYSFYVGTCGVTQAVLGPNKLVDGGLEVWTTSTNLTNWTEETVFAGGGTIATQEATTVFRGNYSVVFGGLLNAGGGRGIAQTTTAGGGASSAIAFKVYRFCGAYLTQADAPAGIDAMIQVQIGASYALPDGRDWTATNTRITLAKTNGQWRRFAFDFMAPADGHITARVMAYSTYAARASPILFDALGVHRIYRFEYQEPMLPPDSVPTHEEGRLGIFFDRWVIGSGQLGILNKDGRLETLAGQFELSNRRMYSRVGGKFADGGNEILPEDMLERLWITRKITVTDTLGQLQLDDPRTIFQERLPNRYLNTSTFSGMSATDIGRPRAMFWGEIENIKPARVSLDANGAPVYELIDAAYRVHATAIGSVVAVYAYLDEEAADKADSARRRALDVATMVTLASTGQVSFTTPPAAVEIATGSNNLLDFDEGAAALVGTIAQGVYLVAESNDGGGLLKQMENALDAAGGTYDVTYSTVTKKATAARQGGGTFNILLTSGAANRDQAGWREAGFTGNVDRTGASSYESDEVIFSDPDAECIVRMTASGYVDDAAGTYTGSSTATIQKAGDILYHMLRKVLAVDPALIDTASVAAVRTGAQNMHVYLGGLEAGAAGDTSHEFGQIVEWLENSSGIELLQDGPMFTFRKRDNTVPANIVDLYDRDFLSFESWYEDDDMASTVRVESYMNPSTGQVASAEVSTNVARLRLGKARSKVVATYCATLAEVQDQLDGFVVNTSNYRRRFKFTVKGKLLRKIVGDKVRINRDTFLGRKVSATTVVVRIISKRDNDQTFESEVNAAEVLSITDGY